MWEYIRFIAAVIIVLILIGLYFYILWKKRRITGIDLWKKAKSCNRVSRRNIILRYYNEIADEVRKDAKRGVFYYGRAYRDLDENKIERVALGIAAWRLFKLRNPKLDVKINYFDVPEECSCEGDGYRLKPKAALNWHSAIKIEIDINW